MSVCNIRCSSSKQQCNNEQSVGHLFSLLFWLVDLTNKQNYEHHPSVCEWKRVKLINSMRWERTRQREKAEASKPSFNGQMEQQTEKGTPKSAKKGNIAHYLLPSIKVRSSGCSQIELLTESASLNFQRTSTHWPTTSSDKWPAPGGHSRSQALIRLQEKKKKQCDGNDDDRHWKQIETGRRKSMSVQSCCTNWLYALIKLIG